jgi:GT2 family glycosyltransferase
MKLSVITLSYNTAAGTEACLRSILAGGVPDQEVIVVDQASQDDSVARIKRLGSGVKLIESAQNLGFAKGCNLAAQRTHSEYLAFINSDCILRPDALPRLVGYLDEHPEVSAAVPRLIEGAGRVQANIAHLPTLKNIFDEYILGRLSAPYDASAITTPQPVDSFSGAALVIRRADFLSAGQFYDQYFMYVEDVELSFQLKRLHKTAVYLPTAVMRHDPGQSSGRERRKLARMLHDNRIDYTQRHFPPVQALLATWVIWLGVGIIKLKHAIKNHIRANP